MLDELGVAGVVDPGGRAGHVHVALDGPWSAVRERVLGLRSIHRAVRPVATLELPATGALEAVRRWVAEQHGSIAELADPSTSFRVSCKRLGTHPFTSEDVARVAGAGVRDAAPHPVDLKGFEVELRCDVDGTLATLGVQLTGRSHAQRRVGPYSQRTSLRSNVAWALLALTRVSAPTAVLDPFAGAGTVLAEAGRRWPAATLAGGDRSEQAVAGSAANLAAAGLGERSTLRLHDARRLAEAWPDGAFDLIATNPPFGHRLGQGEDLLGFYGAVLDSVDRVATDDAHFALLVHRRGAFNRALARSPRWTTRHVRVIELGGLYVGLFVLGRPPG